MAKYHDEEWGVPSHDDQHLFEMLILEGAQAGLSWETILKRRETYRRAFEDFDVEAVAAFGPDKVESLMNDPGIIRNRAKILATIDDAKAFLLVKEEFGSFDAYIWQFVGNAPIVNERKSMSDVPAVTQEAEAMSRDLKKRGFRFVGPTICYAYMQACGMVDDHLLSCFRRM